MIYKPFATAEGVIFPRPAKRITVTPSRYTDCIIRRYPRIPEPVLNDNCRGMQYSEMLEKSIFPDNIVLRYSDFQQWDAWRVGKLVNHINLRIHVLHESDNLTDMKKSQARHDEWLPLLPPEPATQYSSVFFLQIKEINNVNQLFFITIIRIQEMKGR